MQIFDLSEFKGKKNYEKKSIPQISGNILFSIQQTHQQP